MSTQQSWLPVQKKHQDKRWTRQEDVIQQGWLRLGNRLWNDLNDIYSHVSVTHKCKHEKRALSTVCRTAVSYPQMTSCSQGTGPCALFPPSLHCSCLTSRILYFPDTRPIRIHSSVLIFRVLAHVSWRLYTNTWSTAFSPSPPPAQWKQNLPILQMVGLMEQRDIPPSCHIGTFLNLFLLSWLFVSHSTRIQ